MNNEQLDDLQILKKYVVKEMFDNTKDCFMFEHGPFRTKSTTGCGVDHCHLHLINTKNIDLLNLAKKRDPNFNWSNHTNLSKAMISLEDNLSYLLLEDANGIIHTTQKKEFESQFFRKIIAKEIGIEEKYDWKCNYFMDQIKSTLDNFNTINTKCQMMEQV